MDATALLRAVERASAQAGEAWLGQVRRTGLERFAHGGFPTTAEEDWRYTDLRPAAEITAAHLAGADAAGPEATATLGMWPASGVRAVLRAGSFRPELSHCPQRPGLRIVPFAAAPPEVRSRLAGRLSRTTAAGGALVGLNAALMRDGVLVEIDADTVLGEPVHIVLANAQASYNRIVVSLGPRSRATVIEHHASAAGGLSNSVTDLICEDGSRLDYIKLQSESASAVHLATQVAWVARDAALSLLHLDLGSRLARNDLAVELAGENAQVAADGLFYADESRHLDNHTRIDHRAPNSRSREHYRGIADGSGRGVFNGKVIVHPGAVRSDARLVNQNLLLSRSAEIDTKPELEIYTDDVKCSHGATTGQLDPAAIFYMRARGIGIEQARRMLIASFARQIVERLPPGPLHEHVLSLLGARLPDLAWTAAS